MALYSIPINQMVSKKDSTSATGAAHSPPVTPKYAERNTTLGTRKATSRERESTIANIE